MAYQSPFAGMQWGMSARPWDLSGTAQPTPAGTPTPSKGVPISGQTTKQPVSVEASQEPPAYAQDLWNAPGDTTGITQAMNRNTSASVLGDTSSARFIQDEKNKLLKQRDELESAGGIAKLMAALSSNPLIGKYAKGGLELMEYDRAEQKKKFYQTHPELRPEVERLLKIREMGLPVTSALDDEDGNWDIKLGRGGTGGGGTAAGGTGTGGTGGKTKTADVYGRIYEAAEKNPQYVADVIMNASPDEFRGGYDEQRQLFDQYQGRSDRLAGAANVEGALKNTEAMIALIAKNGYRVPASIREMAPNENWEQWEGAIQHAIQVNDADLQKKLMDAAGQMLVNAEKGAGLLEGSDPATIKQYQPIAQRLAGGAAPLMLQGGANKTQAVEDKKNLDTYDKETNRIREIGVLTKPPEGSAANTDARQLEALQKQRNSLIRTADSLYRTKMAGYDKMAGGRQGYVYQWAMAQKIPQAGAMEVFDRLARKWAAKEAGLTAFDAANPGLGTAAPGAAPGTAPASTRPGVDPNRMALAVAANKGVGGKPLLPGLGQQRAVPAPPAPKDEPKANPYAGMTYQVFADQNGRQAKPVPDEQVMQFLQKNLPPAAVKQAIAVRSELLVKARDQVFKTGLQNTDPSKAARMIREEFQRSFGAWLNHEHFRHRTSNPDASAGQYDNVEKRVNGVQGLMQHAPMR